jgi:hypothetical protein
MYRTILRGNRASVFLPWKGHLNEGKLFLSALDCALELIVGTGCVSGQSVSILTLRKSRNGKKYRHLFANLRETAYEFHDRNTSPENLTVIKYCIVYIITFSNVPTKAREEKQTQIFDSCFRKAYLIAF